MTNFYGWTLFLDRDGVINKRIPGSYVRHWGEFDFLEGALEAIASFKTIFKHIVVVTNQQGVGKGLMSKQDLESIHQRMTFEIVKRGGSIDKVYYCPELKVSNPPCRKPNSGMALQAKEDFPAINFKESVIVGDSISDMEFGIRLGMKTVYIETKKEELLQSETLDLDYRFGSLHDFSKLIK